MTTENPAEPGQPEPNPLSSEYSYASSAAAAQKAENVRCINCIVLTDVSEDVLGVVQSIKQCNNKGPCILDLNEAKALVDAVREGNPMSVYSNITSQEAARGIIEELEGLGAEVVWKGFDPSSEDLDALNAGVVHSSSIVDSKIASFVECSDCVVLTRINNPDQRMNVLKAVKKVLNLNTQDANDWISNLLQSIMNGMSETQAQALIEQFESLGVGVVYK